MKKLFLTLLLSCTLLISAGQQPAGFVPNYDEDKVPLFEVPDPLRTSDGKRIKNVKQWEKYRRTELLDFFAKHVYGEVPGEIEGSKWEVIEQSSNALQGKATRKQIDLQFEKNGRTLAFNILLYTPNNREKAPLFLGYNFSGNHTVTDDDNIRISEAWARNNPGMGITNNQLTEQSRGAGSDSWQLNKLIEAGYGLATIYYGEVDPDKDDFTDGPHPFFYTVNQQRPADNEWGSIAAWAWGLSRAMDYLEQDAGVDASRVVVFGHSRLGKTSLWAGATDTRFAAVIANNSGCGGAALSKRQYGETVGRINEAFPHWFAGNFKKYSNNEQALPADQHQLLALIAPRPLYIAAAEDDKWADPKGEFLSAFHATPVYRLYNKDGMPSDVMPQANKPVHATLAYHLRTGGHDVTAYDWEQYIRWADKYLP